MSLRGLFNTSVDLLRWPRKHVDHALDTERQDFDEGAVEKQACTHYSRTSESRAGTNISSNCRHHKQAE